MKRTKSESLNQSHSDSKRIKFCPPENKYNLNLSNFPDTILLHIFQYVSSFDLMSLHLSCNRFRDLCCDRSLWTSLDLREKYLSLEELEKYIRFMQPVTKSVALKASKVNDEFQELPLNFLNHMIEKCEKIQSFIVEDFKISRQRIQITNFPKTLEKLSLKGTQIVPSYERSYLFRIDFHMPILTCLILTNCNWLNSHSFLAISKLPELKEVRLNSCHGLSEEIAYASIACIHGFKKLEVLDLRDTFIGDSVLSSFSNTNTLTEIYLERPSSRSRRQHPEEFAEGRQVIHVNLQAAQNNHLNEADQDNFILNLANDANDTDRCQVTDRSICTLGVFKKGNNQVIENYDEIQIIHGQARKTTNPNLKKLVVRNYAHITNRILCHFGDNGPNLEYLDVTGTSITKEGLQNFKIHRPSVMLISSFDKI